MTPDAPLARLLCELARAPSPLLLASDLDGTLAPIVPRPADARVPAPTLAALERLAPRARVAVVTGRDLATARRLVPVRGVEFVASHGHEASFAAPSLPPPPDPALAKRFEALAQTLEARFEGAGLLVERKARSVAFHYRAAPSLAAPLRARLREALPAGARLQPGRFVFEVLPEGAGKDAALDALVERFAPRAILALGDDLTDAPMLAAARRLRAKGTRVLTLAVAGGPETPPETLAAADRSLEQHQVGALLASLADELEAAPPA